jgi:hypothetical protein
VVVLPSLNGKKVIKINTTTKKKKHKGDEPPPMAMR